MNHNTKMVLRIEYKLEIRNHNSKIQFLINLYIYVCIIFKFLHNKLHIMFYLFFQYIYIYIFTKDCKNII